LAKKLWQYANFPSRNGQKWTEKCELKWGKQLHGGTLDVAGSKKLLDWTTRYTSFVLIMVTSILPQTAKLIYCEASCRESTYPRSARAANHFFQPGACRCQVRRLGSQL
jgi:hypothetical protein